MGEYAPGTICDLCGQPHQVGISHEVCALLRRITTGEHELAEAKEARDGISGSYLELEKTLFDMTTERERLRELAQAVWDAWRVRPWNAYLHGKALEALAAELPEKEAP